MDLEEIKTQYSNASDKYEKLKNEVKYILEEKLKEANIPYHMLNGRVKTLDSVLTKAKRLLAEEQTVGLDEIVDICGIRVICLFLSDVKRIGKIIEEKFHIESKDDKVLSKPQEEFGYLSVHYIGKLPKSFRGPRYDEIKSLRFEIQVRTIAMHAWATISHYLDYKSPHSVPSDLRKDFYGLSALFYLADSHFELFFRKGQQSRESVEKKAHDVLNMSDEEINLDTFTAYLRRKFPDRRQRDPSATSKLVEELIAADYTTIGDLDSDIERSKLALAHYEKEYRRKRPKLSGVGVVRVSLSIASRSYRKVKMIRPSSASEMGKRFNSCRKYVKSKYVK